MNEKEMKEIRFRIVEIVSFATGTEYARQILGHKREEDDTTFIEDVVNDVISSSGLCDGRHYNDDDIRLAIGRVLTKRMGIVI